jgi:hypothetical protein
MYVMQCNDDTITRSLPHRVVVQHGFALEELKKLPVLARQDISEGSAGTNRRGGGGGGGGRQTHTVRER